MRQVKAALKRSAFAVGVVGSIRGAVSDLQALTWNLARTRRITAYLKTAQPRKLHLGASRSVLPGWLNTDLHPSESSIRLDVTQPFPLADDTFDYIFAEHMIEHIDYDNAALMLRECRRVLKRGGVIRLATPDLEVLIGLHAEVKSTAQQRYIDWIIRNFLPAVEACKDVFVINNAFRAWGHRFLYDRSTLRLAMVRAGFEGITFYRPGESADQSLRGLESHGKEIGNDEMNQFVTFVAEGRAAK